MCQAMRANAGQRRSMRARHRARSRIVSMRAERRANAQTSRDRRICLPGRSSSGGLPCPGSHLIPYPFPITAMRSARYRRISAGAFSCGAPSTRPALPAPGGRLHDVPRTTGDRRGTAARWRAGTGLAEPPTGTRRGATPRSRCGAGRTDSRMRGGRRRPRVLLKRRGSRPDRRRVCRLDEPAGGCRSARGCPLGDGPAGPGR